MKLFKSLLIISLFLANLVFVQPAAADKPKFTKNPDYIEVTKTLNNLLSAKDAQAQQKIDELKFQKYILETGVTWGQCRNETGKTLAVYGSNPDEDDDDDDSSYENALYFLAPDQTTKTEWDCEGVYLPSGVKTTVLNSDGQNQEVSGPVAVKIDDGTKLVVQTNPATGAVEFNVTPTKVLKAGDVNWFIPNVSQEVIDTRVTNAPAAKIAEGNKLAVRSNLEPAVVKSNTPPKTQLQPQSESQPQPQPESEKILPSMRIKWNNK